MSRICSIAVIVTALVTVSTGIITPIASGASDDISYTVGDSTITIKTSNVTVTISKAFPAAVVRFPDAARAPGYGFALSSIIGLNASADMGAALGEARYRAPTDNTTWTVIGPTEAADSADGHTVTVTLRATLDMHRRIASGGPGSGGQGSPGIETISDWGTVQVTFTVSTQSRFVSYDGYPQPRYQVNGTSEVKFDIQLSLLKVIDADNLTFDLGLMEMDDSQFMPSTHAGPYRFVEYQSSGVTVSDPRVNEISGTTTIVHAFQYTNQFKQMVAYQEDNVSMGHFSWANQARLTWSGGDALREVGTYYRTDGQSLRMYLSTPLNDTTLMIQHDPSLGVFPSSSGYVHLPNGGIFGTSAMSVAVGVVIGLAAAGGAGVYWSVRGRRVEKDPADLVSLEKNRYFRGRK